MQGIVGVEITIVSLTGQLKASQNQPERNRVSVKAGLEGGEGGQARVMAFSLSLFLLWGRVF